MAKGQPPESARPPDGAALQAEYADRLHDLCGRRRVLEARLEESVERGPITEADLAGTTEEFGRLDAEIRTVSILERAAATRARQDRQTDDERAYHTAVDQYARTVAVLLEQTAPRLEAVIDELAALVTTSLDALSPDALRDVVDERTLSLLRTYDTQEPFVDLLARRLRTTAVLRDQPVMASQAVGPGTLTEWMSGRTRKIVDLVRRAGPQGNTTEEAS